MFRRPLRGGMVRRAERTAVVAGTATVVAGEVHQHQEAAEQPDAEQQLSAQQQAAPPPEQAAPPAPEYAPPAPPPNQQRRRRRRPRSKSRTVLELERLAEMHGSGVLTDEEYTAAKQRVLAGE